MFEKIKDFTTRMMVKIQACEKSEPDKILKGLYNKSHKNPACLHAQYTSICD